MVQNNVSMNRAASGKMALKSREATDMPDSEKVDATGLRLELPEGSLLLKGPAWLVCYNLRDTLSVRNRGARMVRILLWETLNLPTGNDYRAQDVPLRNVRQRKEYDVMGRDL